MASKIQILRSNTFGARPAVGAQPYGVPYVNFADKQFGVVDGSLTPIDMVGVPFFSPLANYNAGQPVNYLGRIYKANVNITAGSWNATQWSEYAALADVPIVPYDVIGYSGLQVNGSFEIAQEFGSGAVVLPPGGQYLCDVFTAYGLSNNSISGMQGGLYGGISFKNHLLIYSNAANPSIAAADAAGFDITIEGYRAAKLMWGTAQAQPITISFWVAASMSGTLGFAVRNGTGGSTNRSYVVAVPINNPNVWEYKTVTVPGDTSGTWYNDNRIGLFAQITMASGTNWLTSTLNAWQTGLGICAPTTQSNFMVTSGFGVRVANVMILPGTIAPTSSQQPYIQRPFYTELPEVQRQYCKSYNYADLPGTVTGNGAVQGTGIALNATTLGGGITQQFPVPMRIVPSVVIYNPTTGAGGSVSLWSPSSGALNIAPTTTPAEKSFQLSTSSASGMTAGAAVNLYYHWAGRARM